MLVEEKIFISPNYNAKQYLDIELTSSSNYLKWYDAVTILKDRIEGRYLNPIQELIHCSPNAKENKNIITNGFAAMALMCLLIETFMQFRYGLKETPPSKAGELYQKFMNEYLGYGSTESYRFYADIRCGILHSAETKNGSMLIPIKKPKTIEIITENRRTSINVSIQNMFNDLQKYFQEYCNELFDSKNTELRENFIKKMDAVTTKHKGYKKSYTMFSSNRDQHINHPRLTK